METSWTVCFGKLAHLLLAPKISMVNKLTSAIGTCKIVRCPGHDLPKPISLPFDARTGERDAVYWWHCRHRCPVVLCIDEFMAKGGHWPPWEFVWMDSAWSWKSNGISVTVQLEYSTPVYKTSYQRGCIYIVRVGISFNCCLLGNQSVWLDWMFLQWNVGIKAYMHLV